MGCRCRHRVGRCWGAAAAPLGQHQRGPTPGMRPRPATRRAPPCTRRPCSAAHCAPAKVAAAAAAECSSWFKGHHMHGPSIPVPQYIHACVTLRTARSTAPLQHPPAWSPGPSGPRSCARTPDRPETRRGGARWVAPWRAPLPPPRPRRRPCPPRSAAPGRRGVGWARTNSGLLAAVGMDGGMRGSHSQLNAADQPA